MDPAGPTVDECLRRLGRDPRSLRSVRPLAGSASGARVALLRLGDDEVVLKTTTRREAAFYRTACRLPVRIPRLVAAAGLCLLLEAAAPGPAAVDWPVGRWHEVARQLGALHRTAVAFHGVSWLKRPGPARRPDAAARSCWPAADLALLDRIGDLDAGLPACLVHGDLHAGNLVRAADGGLVWADWQEVGVGRGPEDLALLWQRAEFDGADPPRTAMLATYAAARGIPYDDVLTRATAAAELRLLLLDWPIFLAGAAPERRAVMVRRLRGIAAAIA
jgi:hypothetical protein